MVHAGIVLGLQGVEPLEVGVRAGVAVGKGLRFFHQFDEPPNDFPSVGVREAGQLDQDLRWQKRRMVRQAGGVTPSRAANAATLAC